MDEARRIAANNITKLPKLLSGTRTKRAFAQN
jgi:hypothetical protein